MSDDKIRHLEESIGKDRARMQYEKRAFVKSIIFISLAAALSLLFARGITGKEIMYSISEALGIAPEDVPMSVIGAAVIILIIILIIAHNYCKKNAQNYMNKDKLYKYITWLILGVTIVLHLNMKTINTVILGFQKGLSTVECIGKGPQYLIVEENEYMEPTKYLIGINFYNGGSKPTQFNVKFVNADNPEQEHIYLNSDGTPICFNLEPKSEAGLFGFRFDQINPDFKYGVDEIPRYNVVIYNETESKAFEVK